MFSRPASNSARLPEIGGLTTESQPPSSERTYRSTHHHKARPSYLARRVSHDELFSALPKPIVNGLTKIQEEENVGFEDVELVESDEEGNTEEQMKNIFHVKNPISSRYKEYGKGPTIAETGQLVKHSIVGPVDVFERQQRALRKVTVKESMAALDNKDLNIERSASKILKPSTTLVLGDQSATQLSRQTTQNRIGTQSALMVNKINSSEKKRDAKNVRVTKEELYSKIDHFRQQQKQFYKNEFMKHQNTPNGDILYQSKDERCMEKFNKTINNWDHTMDSISQKAKRPTSMSVMMQSDGFRGKMEEAEAFTLAQSEQERFGTAYWYMSLRRQKGYNDKEPRRVIQDIPGGFRSPQVYQPGGELEVIRKVPKLTHTMKFDLPAISEAKSIDRTKREYTLEKTKALKKSLKKILVQSTGGADELVVEGANKLDLETQAFLSYNKYNEVFVVPKHVFQQNNKAENDAEYIVKNYESREILRSGLHVLVE